MHADWTAHPCCPKVEIKDKGLDVHVKIAHGGNEGQACSRDIRHAAPAGSTSPMLASTSDGMLPPTLPPRPVT